MIQKSDQIIYAKLYINLLKKSVCNLLYPESEMWYQLVSRRFPGKYIAKILAFLNLRIFYKRPFDLKKRQLGLDWPINAHTMIGLKRLENIQYCLERIINNEIPGDLIETGVWRGGACIFIRGILKAYDIRDRKVWVADSFQGLPKADVGKYPYDQGTDFSAIEYLKISLKIVQDNFRRYDLLDNQVIFLKGWFKDTLPKAPIKKICLLRIDGDTYGSTIVALEALYPKLSAGGYIIIDDFEAILACKQAVLDYRKKQGIFETIVKIDGSGVYWMKKNKTNGFH